jgi:hypothetical protein
MDNQDAGSDQEVEEEEDDSNREGDTQDWLEVEVTVKAHNRNNKPQLRVLPWHAGTIWHSNIYAYDTPNISIQYKLGSSCTLQLVRRYVLQIQQVKLR